MKEKSMEKNSYKVPRSQWAKWSELARRVFNEVYGSMAYNQKIFLPPKAKTVADEQWVITSYNAAWTAAHAVDTK
jgi:hypothetical protein